MYRAGIVAYIFKISALREQRQVQSQPALQNKFQDSQGYPEKPFLETPTFPSENPHKNKQKSLRKYPLSEFQWWTWISEDQEETKDWEIYTK